MEKIDKIKYLFWDVDTKSIDFEKHCRFIIERVITHGNLSDWNFIKKVYSIQKIKEEVVQIRSLDKKTLNFLSVIYDIPLKKFRCYTQTQSKNTHWNY
jgi:hypothetical protein